jgi:hypothetical protein
MIKAKALPVRGHEDLEERHSPFSPQLGRLSNRIANGVLVPDMAERSKNRSIILLSSRDVVTTQLDTKYTGLGQKEHNSQESVGLGVARCCGAGLRIQEGYSARLSNINRGRTPKNEIFEN